MKERGSKQNPRVGVEPHTLSLDSAEIPEAPAAFGGDPVANATDRGASTNIEGGQQGADGGARGLRTSPTPETDRFRSVQPAELPAPATLEATTSPKPPEPRLEAAPPNATRPPKPPAVGDKVRFWCGTQDAPIYQVAVLERIEGSKAFVRAERDNWLYQRGLEELERVGEAS